MIRRAFEGFLCAHADVASLVENDAAELAYTLMVVFADNPDLQRRMKNLKDLEASGKDPAPAGNSRDGPCEARQESSAQAGLRINPWVVQNFPRIARVQEALCLTPCEEGCAYCNRRLDMLTGLRSIFEYDTFRTYEGEPLQERAARAAMAGKSLLAIFPTGGGKSLTFQLPALLAYRATGALTVVISPLQSLVVDQVRGLKQKGISEAVAINGQIDPLERMTPLSAWRRALPGFFTSRPSSCVPRACGGRF